MTPSTVPDAHTAGKPARPVRRDGLVLGIETIDHHQIALAMKPRLGLQSAFMSDLSYAHGACDVPLLGETIGANFHRTAERPVGKPVRSLRAVRCDPCSDRAEPPMTRRRAVEAEEECSRSTLRDIQD